MNSGLPYQDRLGPERGHVPKPAGVALSHLKAPWMIIALGGSGATLALAMRRTSLSWDERRTESHERALVRSRLQYVQPRGEWQRRSHSWSILGQWGAVLNGLTEADFQHAPAPHSSLFCPWLIQRSSFILVQGELYGVRTGRACIPASCKCTRGQGWTLTCTPNTFISLLLHMILPVGCGHRSPTTVCRYQERARFVANSAKYIIAGAYSTLSLTLQPIIFYIRRWTTIVLLDTSAVPVG